MTQEAVHDLISIISLFDLCFPLLTPLALLWPEADLPGTRK